MSSASQRPHEPLSVIRMDARLDATTRQKVDDLAQHFHQPRAAVLCHIMEWGLSHKQPGPLDQGKSHGPLRHLAMLASVEEALRRGERVTLVGFGTCAVRARAARSGRHPRTGQPLVVPARKTPTFTVGKRLRQVVHPENFMRAPRRVA